MLLIDENLNVVCGDESQSLESLLESLCDRINPIGQVTPEQCARVDKLRIELMCAVEIVGCRGTINGDWFADPDYAKLWEIHERLSSFQAERSR